MNRINTTIGRVLTTSALLLFLAAIVQITDITSARPAPDQPFIESDVPGGSKETLLV